MAATPPPPDPAPPRDDELEPGTAMGDYVIARLLGRGAAGEVYEAKHRPTGKWIAVKFLSRSRAEDPRKLKRFEAEAAALAKCRHPNIVGFHGAGVWNGRRYLAQELVVGASVEDFLHKKGRLGWREACRVAEQVCRGLAAAHAVGLIHRDIKPGNILYSRDGTAKLTDFGLAKDQEAPETDLRLTVENAVVGTPAYISPEQARRTPLDGRADIYSLGAVLYALLVGQGPYRDEAKTPMDLIACHLAKPPPDPRKADGKIPEACARIVLKAMAKERDERFQSAGEMADALAVAAGPDAGPDAGISDTGEDLAEFARQFVRPAVRITTPSGSQSNSRPMGSSAGRRNRAVWLGFAVGLAAVGLTLALVLPRGRGPADPKKADAAKQDPGRPDPTDDTDDAGTKSDAAESTPTGVGPGIPPETAKTDPASKPPSARQWAWQVAGPFAIEPDKDPIDVAAFLKKPDFTPGYAGAEGRHAIWRPVIAKDDGRVQLSEFFQSEAKWAAYAYTTFHAEADGDIAMRISADDQVVVWVNGARVGSAGQEAVPLKVRVRRGDNSVMLTADNRGGFGWWFLVEAPEVACSFRPAPRWNWRIAGPFPIEPDKDVIGVADFSGKPDFSATYAGVAGKQASWRPVEAEEKGKIDLGRLYGADGAKWSAYAYTVIRADKEGKSLLDVFADDEFTLWLNGALVTKGRYGWHARVRLRRGDNAVVLRIDNSGGEAWHFSMQAPEAACTLPPPR